MPSPDDNFHQTTEVLLPGAASVPTNGGLGKVQPEKTSRQGSVEPFTTIVGPGAWYAKDYKNADGSLRTDWIWDLTEAEIRELDAAVAHAAASKNPIQELTQADFPLPTLGPKLVATRDEVNDGRGFALIRGIPVERYSRKESLTAYWGFGTYWGRANSQNAKGHLIGHVKDIGHDPKIGTTRIYATSVAQPYHADSADMVGLLCLSLGESGGLSSWSSSITAHNEVLRRAPELAPVFAEPWYWDRKNEVPEGKKGYYAIPVFNYYKGYLSINYSAHQYIHLAQRHADVPRITPQLQAAMDLFEGLAASNELRLDYNLQPGDLQLLSNNAILHTRSAYKDGPDKKRHLLRLWISAPTGHPLPECYAESWNSVEVGNRGGIICHGVAHNPIPLEAE